MEPAQHRKAVGIWIRVSTEDQAKGESPEHHEKRARLYAEAKDWNIIEVYNLAGVSGKSVTQHPEAKRMLADVRAGRITGLIFSKLARLARNTKDLLELSELFRDHGADLISLQESIDTTTPAGRLFYTMIAGMAQWEREEIADRVAASVPIRAKLGKPLGGKPPYGYQWKDKKVVPHPDEAPVRKLIYELFVENRRKKAVARILNDRGYRTSNGSQFTDTTIGRLIRDMTAKGILRVNYTKVGKRSGHVEIKPESDWVLHEVEPIVSEDLWAQANAILEGQKDGRKRPGPRGIHLFAGLTFCECGHKMYVPHKTPKYACWTCGTKIPVVDLEAIYHEQLRGFLFSDEQVAEQMDQADRLLVEKQAELEHFERERLKVQKDMDRVYELYSEGQMTPAGFGARYRPLEERLAQIDGQLPAAQAALDIMRINTLSSAEILSEARDLHGRWPTLGHTEKKTIVEAITEKIVIGKETVDIHLHYLPGPGERPTPPKGGGKSPDSKGSTGGSNNNQSLVSPSLSGNDPSKATQPKACNYALPFARGEFVVVYDAEDIPDPDQLRRAVAAFRGGDTKLACVQAQLNYYNWSENWLTRQFAIEYSSFFDLLLPTLAKLGMPIPLGGTSTHFKTALLRQAGAWDPFNVTEDADLGMRFALLGLRTGIIRSTTQEEANCEFDNWLRQRSRWIKGWIQTYLVRMRHPVDLYRALGFRGFIGFQIVIGGFSLANLIHPVFYLAMLISLVSAQRLGDLAANPPIIVFNLTVLVSGFGITMLAGMAATATRGLRPLIVETLMMPAYWLLISAGAYKALFQLILRPFHWEKTVHGISRLTRAQLARVLFAGMTDRADSPSHPRE